MSFILDTRLSVCYTFPMIAPKLQPITNIEALSVEILAYREMELDRALLNTPAVIAQKVERELIKRLQITAPYLVPMVIK